MAIIHQDVVYNQRARDDSNVSEADCKGALKRLNEDMTRFPILKDLRNSQQRVSDLSVEHGVSHRGRVFEGDKRE